MPLSILLGASAKGHGQREIARRDCLIAFRPAERCGKEVTKPSRRTVP
jgi:hypothetical protein